MIFGFNQAHHPGVFGGIMNQLQLKAYLENQGIEHITTGKRLRVMDKSLLPQAYRDYFDERGFLLEGKMDETKKDEEAALEAAKKLTKKIDAVLPMGETEKEMTVMGLLNPDGDTKVPAHLESHEPKGSSLLQKEMAAGEEEVVEEADEPKVKATTAPKGKGKKK
jgi:hypothetical protein